MSCEEGTELSRADNLFNKGEYGEAVEMYTEFLRLHPEHTKTLYNRGRAYEEMNEYEKALEDFNSVLKKDFTHVQANISVAKDFYFRQKDYHKAITFLNTAIKHSPQNAIAFTMRGKAYQKLGEVDKALKEYNNAISIDNTLGEAYYSRGSLWIHLRKKEKACSDFDIAISLGNKDALEATKQYCK